MAGHSETIANLYAAFSRGDVPTVLAALGPNVIWKEAEGFPYVSSPVRLLTESTNDSGLFARHASMA